MPASKRVDASSIYSQKRPSVLEKMVTGEQAPPPVAPEQEREAPAERPKASGRTLKQVAFAIGEEREQCIYNIPC